MLKKKYFQILLHVCSFVLSLYRFEHLISTDKTAIQEHGQNERSFRKKVTQCKAAGRPVARPTGRTNQRKGKKNSYRQI